MLRSTAPVENGSRRKTLSSFGPWLLGLALFVTAASAQEQQPQQKPFLSLEDGLNSDSKLLRPGKTDFLFKYRGEEQQYNFFGWTPIFKGGAGLIETENRPTTRYAGGFLRPLAAWPERGDLIVAAQTVQAGSRDDYEVQGEYRLPMGLGFGGGYVEASKPGNDIAFGKVTYRNHWDKWNYIFELQGQEVASEASPGGYGALFNDQFMFVGGTDGEQWRTTFGYIAPETKSIYRPTFEALYVDNTIGRFNGPKSIFMNGTLGYRGGFLSHPARLGRAMGPQGLEFGNPLGFLIPTWNRRLETWEMGQLVDARVEKIWLPNHTSQERYEALVYPFQFFDTQKYLQYLFVGGAYVNSRALETAGVIGGFAGRLGFLNVSLGVEYQTRTGHTALVVGLIDPF